MKKGDNITLDKVKGKIVKMLFWVDGTKFVRLKDKNGNLSDHLIQPEIQIINKS